MFVSTEPFFSSRALNIYPPPQVLRFLARELDLTLPAFVDSDRQQQGAGGGGMF